MTDQARSVPPGERLPLLDMTEAQREQRLNLAGFFEPAPGVRHGLDAYTLRRDVSVGDAAASIRCAVDKALALLVVVIDTELHLSTGGQALLWAAHDYVRLIAGSLAVINADADPTCACGADGVDEADAQAAAAAWLSRRSATRQRCR